MKRLKVNFKNVIGKIKPMHAINNVPLLGSSDQLFHHISEAGIPFSRLHDTGGAYGGGRFVDIANIFRNPDADENDPASYEPFKAYYSLKAFNLLYRTQNQAEVTDVPTGISCVAASGESTEVVMLVNSTEQTNVNFESDSLSEMYIYRINENMNLEYDGIIDGGFEIEKFETVILINKRMEHKYEF